MAFGTCQVHAFEGSVSDSLLYFQTTMCQRVSSPEVGADGLVWTWPKLLEVWAYPWQAKPFLVARLMLRD